MSESHEYKVQSIRVEGDRVGLILVEEDIDGNQIDGIAIWLDTSDLDTYLGDLTSLDTFILSKLQDRIVQLKTTETQEQTDKTKETTYVSLKDRKISFDYTP